MAMTVRPAASVSSAIWICFSDSESRARGCFVEKENRRVFQQRPRDGQPLLLPPGKKQPLSPMVVS